MSRRGRVSLASALGAPGAAVALLSLSACTNHDCDPSTLDAGPGTVVPQGGALLWESAPAEGPWLAFPGNMTVNFTFPPGFRCPQLPSAYLSTEPYQGPEAGMFIEGTGYLATFSNVTPSGFSVTNGGCAEYYLRLTATASASGCGAPDGGAEAQ